MSVITKDLGAATAYGYAVEKGFTGTEEEFAELMASYATVAQTAVNAAQTATTKASEASTSATAAAGSASTASTKASEASASATTASTKASEASASATSASTSAGTATTKAGEASASATAASTSASAAASHTADVYDATATYAVGDYCVYNSQLYKCVADITTAEAWTAAHWTATNVMDEVSELKEDLTQEIENIIQHGNQVYNKAVGFVHGYARSADGSIRGENTSTCTSWFKCKGGQTYWINLKASYIGFYSGEPEWVLNQDDGYKYPTNYISGYLLNETSSPNQITAPNNAKYVGFSVGHDYTLDTIMVNLGDSALPYEEYTLGILNPSLDVPQVESVKNAIGLSDTSTFDVMYIKDGKACCGKTSNDVTAYYAGVELTGVPTDLDVKWIWEKGTTSGTVAIVLNPNGLYRVSCITNWSLHIAITSTLLQVALMGDRVGQHYYANLINQTINLSLDGETENTAHVTISGNTLTVTINGTQYTGTLSDPTYSLTDFVGKYFIFEHYCTGDRNSVAMPMFTKVEATGGDCERFRDLFNRPSGQLCTSPQGYVYRLFTNLSTYQNYEQSPPVST